MVGPKLEARSYTILLLVVIATLLSLNLFAQYTSDRAMGQRPTLTDQQDNYSEAASSAEIAAATREVAKANREIADAIKELAAAVGKIKLPEQGSMGDTYEGSSSGGTIGRINFSDERDSSDGEATSAPEFDLETGEDETIEGTIEIN